MARTQEQFRQALANNLPQGEAFKAKNIVETVMYKLLFALAYAYWQLDERSNDLINEMYPQSVLESLDEWEHEYGLPSPCYASLQLTTAERKKILLTKFASIGGQNADYYIKIASDLGFTITITEFDGARFTLNQYASQYAYTTHPYVWYVNVAGIETIYARYSTDIYTTTNYSKLGIDTSILECVINELKPAHTQVIFNY